MKSNLTLRVLAIIGITLTVSFAVMGGVCLNLMYGSSLNQQKSNSRQLVSAVKHDILRQMVKGDLKDISGYLSEIKANSNVTDIRIFNSEAIEWSKNSKNEVVATALAAGEPMEFTSEADGKHLLTLALPLVNEEQCKGCHDAKNRFNGALLMTTSLDKERNALFRMMATISGVGAFFFLVILLVLFFFIRKNVVSPIKAICRHVEIIADGDLTTTIESSRSDEIGLLSQDINKMSAGLRTMFSGISAGAHTITSAADYFQGISQAMTGSAERSAVKCQGVAAATEEMSVSMATVAAAMHQATANINMVAAATEEMTSTIDDVARSSGTARTISSQAVERTGRVSEQVIALGKAAREIDKVTETIAAISAQTNLLALNATIEAARAGAAGKGFTVVASEIKELAKQTAAATEGIRERIENIQISTGETVEEIGAIAEIIHEVNEIIATTAVAIDEQSAVARDIASNISQAAYGMKEVNQNVAQTSGVAGSIAEEVSEVNNSVKEISANSSQVLSNAEDLIKLSDHLQRLADQYKLS